MSSESAGEELLWGRHPVVEALRAGRSCRRLVIARGSRGPAIDEVFEEARQRSIPYDLRDRRWLDQHAGRQHQGIVAFMAARQYASFETLLALVDKPGFLVFLDSLQDPHNLGAIIRSAHAVGADGVVVPERGAVGLTGAAVKATAGAADHLPVSRVKNLSRALQQAKKKGFWLVGLDANGGQPFAQVDYRGPCAIVVGAEFKGLRPLVARQCDFLAHIPMAQHQVGSFNASVAAGLVLYEVWRQRHDDGGAAGARAPA